MGKYNFYERNKKTIDKLHQWSVPELVEHRDIVIGELNNLSGFEHPDFVEFLTCAKKEFEKHIKLKTQQQRSTEEV